MSRRKKDIEIVPEAYKKLEQLRRTIGEHHNYVKEHPRPSDPLWIWIDSYLGRLEELIWNASAEVLCEARGGWSMAGEWSKGAKKTSTMKGGKKVQGRRKPL